MDQPEHAPEAEQRQESRAVRGAGRNALALFVVFAVVLLTGFGKAPVSQTAGADGTGVHVDLFSTLGLIGGLFAAFYFPFRLRAILRLPVVRKVLGLIGGGGLLVHSAIAIFLGGPAAGEPAGPGGQQLIAPSGAEEWVIDGRTCRIAGTYYLSLREGLQYTIEVPHRFEAGRETMTRDRALRIALPLMWHAYETGRYRRARVAKVGRGSLAPSRIGVVLVQRDGSKVKGYRIALSIEELKQRMRPAGASTGPA